MRRFVEYQTHDYMDMYPSMGLRVFEGKDLEDITFNAKQWCKYMNENYSGGTTTFVKVWNAVDAKNYLNVEVINEWKRRNLINSHECSFKDWFEEALKHYNECYNNFN